jgi:hypothetical protein
MTPSVSIDVPVEHEQLIRRVLSLAEELHQLALTAPHGAVFDQCENSGIDSGREIQTRMLEQAVARRIEAAEKRGRRSAFASAADARRTVAPKAANS